MAPMHDTGTGSNYIPPKELDCHPGGLADRVRYKFNGTWYTGGMAFVIPMCEDCGALIVDQRLHDEFHLRADPDWQEDDE